MSGSSSSSPCSANLPTVGSEILKFFKPLRRGDISEEIMAAVRLCFSSFRSRVFGLLLALALHFLGKAIEKILRCGVGNGIGRGGGIVDSGAGRAFGDMPAAIAASCDITWL